MYEDEHLEADYEDKNGNSDILDFLGEPYDEDDLDEILYFEQYGTNQSM